MQSEPTSGTNSAGIGQNTAIGLVTNILVFGLGIIISIVLTRSLGPEQRGVYALLVTTNLLLASLANLSMAAPFSTLLARGRYMLGEVHAAAITLSLVMGAVSFLLATLLYSSLADSVFRQVPYSFLLVALLLVPITIYQVYWNAMMMGLNRLILMNKLNIAANSVNTILMLLIVGVAQLGIRGFLIAWTVSQVIGALISLIVAVRIEPIMWPPRSSALRDMLGFGIRVHGASIAHQLFLRFDVYMVNVLVGTTAVGFYSLATSLAEKLWVLPNAIAPSSISTIARLPRQESALITAKVTRAAVMLMLIAAVPFAIVSPWLVPFLYGADFSTSVPPLVILLFGTPAFAAMLVLNNYVLGQMERPGILSIITWLELGISIPLYVIFILWGGIVGAAIASTVTYLIGMLGTTYVFIHDSKLPLHLVLIPRVSDFQDYTRVVRQVLNRLPVLNRYARLSR
jgi:O-antigen/teichoic acid export membrane protein